MMNTLYVESEGDGQAMSYTEYAEHGGSRWRARIKRDFYASRSCGVAERWDGSRWQEVISIPSKRLKVGTVHIGKGSDVLSWEPLAGQDAEYLIGMGSLVIGESRPIGEDAA